MPRSELPYQGMSKTQLEDLLLDSNEDQSQLILVELGCRGEVSKRCLKCNTAIAFGEWCKKHQFVYNSSKMK